MAITFSFRDTCTSGLGPRRGLSACDVTPLAAHVDFSEERSAQVEMEAKTLTPAPLLIPEVLGSIIGLLRSRDQVVVARVCRIWYHLAVNHIWHHLPHLFPLFSLISTSLLNGPVA